GTLPHHLDRVRHVDVRDADLEVEVEIRQRLDTLDEIGPQTKFQIRLKLNDAADAFDQRIRGQPFQVSPRSIALFEGCPRYDPFDARVLRGETCDPLRFLHELRKLALALKKD